MHFSSIIWVESIIETNNKKYTVSAGVPSGRGGIDCVVSIWADGNVKAVPVVGSCYQVVGNFAPARGGAPARMEVLTMYAYTDSKQRFLDIDVDKVSPMTIYIAGTITLRTNEIISVEFADYSTAEGAVTRTVEVDFSHLHESRKGPLQMGRKINCCASFMDVDVFGMLSYQMIGDSRTGTPGSAPGSSNVFSRRKGRTPLTMADLTPTHSEKRESSPENAPSARAKEKLPSRARVDASNAPDDITVFEVQQPVTPQLFNIQQPVTPRSSADHSPQTPTPAVSSSAPRVKPQHSQDYHHYSRQPQCGR